MVDNPFRDLAGLALVATELATAGAVCHLIPMEGQELELQSLGVDAVVLNYLRPGNERLVQRLVSAGVAVFVLDTEGGVFSSMESYSQLLSRNADLRARLTGWMSWGPTLAQHAVSHGWFSESQVIITGSPRFDFYVEPWRQAALDVAPRSTGDPMILVNGNFPIANPRFQTPEMEAATLVKRFGFDAEEVARWQAAQGDTMHRLAEATNRVARKNPDVFFTYRPHPFERLASYERLLEPLPNLVARKDGGVDGWILQSKAVIQRSCTTAIEAGLAGVPALSPTWIPVFQEVSTAEAVSIACSSDEALDQHLRAAVSDTLSLPRAQSEALSSVTNDWFHRVDGRSHRRVAAALLERTTPGDRRHRARDLAEVTTRQRLRASVKGSVPPALWRLRPGRREAMWQRSEKSFSLDQVRDLVAAICRAAQRRPLDVRPGSLDQVHSYRFGRSVTVSPAAGSPT